MKTKMITGLVVLMTAALTVSYWLGSHQSSRSSRARSNAIKTLKPTGPRSLPIQNDLPNLMLTGQTSVAKAPPHR